MRLPETDENMTEGMSSGSARVHVAEASEELSRRREEEGDELRKHVAPRSRHEMNNWTT
jgi:uncharacterized protein YoaH (UPF0181 family)